MVFYTGITKEKIWLWKSCDISTDHAVSMFDEVFGRQRSIAYSAQTCFFSSDKLGTVHKMADHPLTIPLIALENSEYKASKRIAVPARALLLYFRI